MPKNNYVVYVPREGAPCHCIRAEAGIGYSAIEQKIVEAQVRLGQLGLQPGETAYIVLDEEKVRDLRHAGELAKQAGLCFIPRNIILGMRNRNPDVTMREIREDYKRRVTEYNAAATTKPSSAAARATPASSPFEDPFRGSVMDDLESSPFLDALMGHPSAKPK